MNRIPFPAPVLAAVAVLAVSGCGEKPFLKVNGQTISKDEYIAMLERVQIPTQNGAGLSAERLVLDQLVGNKVILAEAARMSVAPTESDINNAYNVRKKIFEQQQPGKSYEDELKKQGTTAEETKQDIKSQLAETAVYARRLNLGTDDVRKSYEENAARLGLPARTQVRLILLSPSAPQFAQAQKLLGEKKPFDEVARQVNVLPALRAGGGLQTMADQNFPPTVLAKLKQTADNAFFGPVDWPLPNNQPPAKAWVKVEKKLPAFKLSPDDAAPLIRQSLVQQRITQPQNLKIRDEVMKLKMDATFQSTDPSYELVWTALKEQAREAGIGQNAALATGLGTAAPPAGKP